MNNLSGTSKSCKKRTFVAIISTNFILLVVKCLKFIHGITLLVISALIFLFIIIFIFSFIYIHNTIMIFSRYGWYWVFMRKNKLSRLTQRKDSFQITTNCKIV